MLHALAFAVAVCASPLALAAGKGPASAQDRSENAVPTSSSDTTSLACYFQKGDSITWYWGLTSDSQWYTLPGSWQTTPYTKLQKFFSTASQSDITQACGNSSTYYGLVGYSLLAAFAADRKAGSNYPIIVGGSTELWPQY
jgi:hypothetical protein